VTDRVPGLNGLRAVAALGILGYHTSLTFLLFRGGHGWYYTYTGHLDVAVSIFFVLSGFLLYRPYAEAHQRGTAAPSLGRYYRKRALRILPAYWAVLTVLIVTARLATSRGDLLWQYSLLRTFSYEHLNNGIPQVWSLSVEVSFYLALPLLAWLVGRRAARRGHRQLRAELSWVLALVVASVAFRVGAPHVLTPRGETVEPFGFRTIQNITTYWFPSWLEMFAAGMGLAAIDAWSRVTGVVPRVLRARWLPAAGVATAAFAYWLVCNHVDVPALGDWHDTIGPALQRQTLYGIVAVGLVAPLAIGRCERREPVRATLASRPLESIGVVSYGVFLVHLAVLTELNGMELTRTWMETFATAFGIATAASIAVATILYFAVERPSQLLARRWQERGTMRAWVTPTSTEPSAGGAVRPEPATTVTTAPTR